MHSHRMSGLVIVALWAIAPDLAQATATMTTRYTYESNVASRNLGCTVTRAGDLNDDGYGDIAASANGGAYAFYGSSGGPFVSTPWIGSGYGSTPAAVGDVNGDGYQDLVTFDLSTPSAAGHVYLFAGSSSGLGSTPITTLVGPADSSEWGAVTGVGDVNGDGYADMVIAAPKYYEDGQPRGRLFIYMGGSGGLASDPGLVGHELTHTLGLVHVGAVVFAAGDANGDGFADIGVAGDKPNSTKQFVMVFPGSTAGPGPTPTWSDSDTIAYCLGPADFNGDGYSDFVAKTGGDSATVFRGGTSGMSHRSVFCEGPCQLLGDIDDDGYTDMTVLQDSHFCICGDPSCAGWPCGYLHPSVLVWFGNKSHSVNWGLAPSLGRISFAGVEAGDVDGDGAGDVLEGNCAYSVGQSNEGRVVVLGWTKEKVSPPHKPEGYIPGNPWSVHAASSGDLDDDGLDDIVVSAPDDPLSEVSQGHVAVCLGSTEGGAGPTFELLGGGPYSSFGASVAGQGDVNGDGYPDLVVGAPNGSNGEPEEGSAYLYYGGTARDPLPDWSVESNLPFAHLGTAVAFAGDVNGDGYADVLVGAPGGQQFAPQDALLPPDDARAQLYLGSAIGLAPLPSWTASGSTASGFATALAGAGDVNGDGYSDVAIGLPDADQVLVYHGSGGGLPAAPSATLTGVGRFGAVIAAAGDVNGDGYADLLVGSPLMGVEAPSGRAQLFMGSGSGLGALPAWTVDGVTGDALGSSLAGGDLDDDGFSDVVVGSPGHDFDRGEVHVYMGSAGGLSLETTVAGSSAGSRLGASVACADRNGDGYGDAVLGQPANGYLGSGNGNIQQLDGGGGLARSSRLQQRRPIGGGPVGLRGSSGATGFRIRALGFGAAGRGHVRLEWQHHTPGAAWGALQHGPWLDSGEPQSEIGSAVSIDAMVSDLAASTPYAWRARVASGGPDVYRNSRWLSMQGIGRNESAIRTGTLVLDAPHGSPPITGRLLTAVRPNPAASLVRVNLSLPGAELVVLDVFDVSGRQVRRITSGSGGATARELTWDLRDDSGRPAGAGLYFLRATAGRLSDVDRVVVLP